MLKWDKLFTKALARNVDVNEHPSEDAKETEFLLPEIDLDISDELLYNIPMPGDVPMSGGSYNITKPSQNLCLTIVVLIFYTSKVK